MKKTIRIIDLLNMISKGEEVPKKIRIDQWSHKFEWVEHLDNYYDIDADIDLMSVLSMNKEQLNYEVEIIEEPKKIEKLNCDYLVPNTPANENEAYIMSCLLAHELKINEIINKIYELKGKSK